MRVLVIEDNQRTADFIKKGLVEEGFAVDTVSTGEEGLQLAETKNYDLIILDILLPDKDGYEVCRILRDKSIMTPLMMLTGRTQVFDRVKGLNSGADDYLVKPFDFDELVARAHALLRREKQILPVVLAVGHVVMDTVNRRVTVWQETVKLTVKEFEVLEYLMRHPNVIVSRTTLEQHVWNQEFDGKTNLVDVYINKLRDKIDKGGENLIQTVWGVGYRLATK